MHTIYFDLISGASGDMLLASLIDLGFPVDYFEQQLAKLGIGNIRIGIQKVRRNGISCTYISPEWQLQTKYRHLGEILEILNRGGFSAQVIHHCEVVLDKLATAESVVHGIEKDHVHFHEIGAVDTIIDILGVCLAIDYLHVQDVLFSTITEGYGTIKAAHGTMPVPVPATAQLLQGYNVRTLDIPTELCTPTGAALLTGLGRQVSGGFSGQVIKVGCGCGTKEFENHPNMLRSFLLKNSCTENTGKEEFVYLLETDMDHISGEIMGNVAQLLFDNGALDVSWTPLFMKKGRPGYRLSVMVDDGLQQLLADLIMIHTRTLGLRIQKVKRITAARTSEYVEFMGEKVSQKQCCYAGRTFKKLENDDLERIARLQNISVLDLVEKYLKDTP